MIEQELPPGAITQSRGRDQQHALPTLLHRVMDQLTSKEGLAQPDLVSDQHAMMLGEHTPRPEQTVLLETGQPNRARAEA